MYPVNATLRQPSGRLLIGNYPLGSDQTSSLAGWIVPGCAKRYHVDAEYSGSDHCLLALQNVAAFWRTLDPIDAPFSVEPHQCLRQTFLECYIMGVLPRFDGTEARARGDFLGLILQ